MKILKFALAVSILSGVVYSCGNDDDFPTGTTADSRRVEVYATSNTTGNITMYNVKDPNSITIDTHITGSADSEGLSYNPTDDQLTYTSRSAGTLNTVLDISFLDESAPYPTGIISTPDLISPRDVTVRGGFYVVSDNSDVDGDPMTDDGRFFIYEQVDDTYVLRNTVTVNFAVWGIQFVGNSLIAVVDKTADVAVFNSFTAMNQLDEEIVPSKRFTLEGMTRTHGIGFNTTTAIFTDIGDASVDNDGGFHIISNFESKLENINDGDTMPLTDQVRISGATTKLGNPVDAAYDSRTNTVYIAERANTGGRILGYVDVSLNGGDIAPTIDTQLAGASSILFYRGD